ncbi:MAG: protein kinase, partial [Deltaproteobacteria bacterium]|nr:protein kinase [Deltaproteobacteria bacterium]
MEKLKEKSDDPLVGCSLPGGHVVIELIDVGGMGRVYRAEQKMLGRTVAVKIIHPHLLGDETVEARFITEARAASQLNHPNSVGVIDFGKFEGRLYMVMEYLRGRDLATVAHEEGPLEIERIIDIL